MKNALLTIDHLETIEPGLVDNMLQKLSGRDLVALSFVNERYLKIVQGLPNSDRRARYEKALDKHRNPLVNPQFYPVTRQPGDLYYQFKTIEEFRELFLTESIITGFDSRSDNKKHFGA